MAPLVPAQKEQQFAHADRKPTNPWKWAFRIVRWSTYAAALITIILVLRNAPPPPVETSPQAAARAEQKFQEVERAVAAGQPATLRMDETELNSYLAFHLELSANEAAQPAASNKPHHASKGVPTSPDVQEMRSNVRDVKVQLLADRVKAYVVFDVHGKDMTLQLEGRLGAQNGYLRFEPVSGQIGSLPIPQSTLESAVQRLMDSPENREKLKLPPAMADLRIENGEVVARYK